MKLRLSTTLLLCAAVPVLAASDSALRFSVLFDQVHGLKADDPVVREGNRVGGVREVRYTREGRFEVEAEVGAEYRAAVTDRCRFVVSSATAGTAKALEMLCLGAGGTPLSDGAAVPGTTRAQVLGEALEGRMKGFLADLRDLPRDWAAQLEQELDRLAEELSRAGEETRRRWQRDVLPELERRLGDLEKWLRERGRGDEAEPLERKLERLKRI